MSSPNQPAAPAPQGGADLSSEKFPCLEPTDIAPRVADEPPTWEQVADALRRCDVRYTLLVEPDQVEDYRAAVAARGWSQRIAVQPGLALPPGKCLLANQNAVDEAVRQAVERSLRERRWR